MRLFFFIILILLTFKQSYSAETSTPTTPYQYPSLRESHDDRLQQGLEKILKQQGLWRQIKRKQLALAVVDISDLKHPKMAELNGDHMMYAASLPKILILLGILIEVQEGRLIESNELDYHLNEMIRFSNNESATHLLYLLGKQRVLDLVQEPQFAFYDPIEQGGLWLGKAYAKGPAYHRDPLFNISHGATAIQAARFYYLMETQQLLNAKYSQKMKKILSKPGIKHKFVKGLSSIKNIKFFRKSGTWRNYHADSALVEFRDHKYILVGLSNQSSGGQWMQNLAMPIHNLLINRQTILIDVDATPDKDRKSELAKF